MKTLRATATGGASGLWYTYRNWRYAILFYSPLLTLATVTRSRSNDARGLKLWPVFGRCGIKRRYLTGIQGNAG